MNTLLEITQRLLPVRIIARGPWQAATFASHDLAHHLSMEVDYGSDAEYRLTDRNFHVIEVIPGSSPSDEATIEVWYNPAVYREQDILNRLYDEGLRDLRMVARSTVPGGNRVELKWPGMQ